MATSEEAKVSSATPRMRPVSAGSALSSSSSPAISSAIWSASISDVPSSATMKLCGTLTRPRIGRPALSKSAAREAVEPTSMARTRGSRASARVIWNWLLISSERNGAE